MFFMRERDVLVDHASFEVFDLMAPFLKAARIADLSMGCTRSLSREEIGQRHLTIDPFPFQVIQDPRFVMALRAGHVAVTRRPPRFEVGIHLMTQATKG
jgi:hypothetical protein